MFDRGASTEFELIDEWDAGMSWSAHPQEGGMRASHALLLDDGVWILDPLDAPGIYDKIETLGEVNGVLVCSSWHSRDADTFAERFDVPILAPRGMDRIEKQLTHSIKWFEGDLADAGVTVIHRRPIPGFVEAILYHESSATLYVPESLGTAPYYRVGTERLGTPLLLRLFPPREVLELTPSRILVGHGAGVTEEPTAALQDAIQGSRRRFSRALISHGKTAVQTGISAIRG